MRRSNAARRSGSTKRPRSAGGLDDGPLDLQTKVKQNGGPLGISLGQTEGNKGPARGNVSFKTTAIGSLSGINGRQAAASAAASTTATSATSTARRQLEFSAKDSSPATTTRTKASGRSRFSRATLKTNHTVRPAVHVVCAISENMARATCIASLDAGSPTELQVTKQGNGQTYAETLAYLELLRPNEVLLNEGRKNSQLARKVIELFHPSSQIAEDGEEDWNVGDVDQPNRSDTVVKFLSRACFDQTRGAEVLRRIARPETYDASLIEEYILLSSAYAVVNYTQQSLGADFSPGSLFLNVNSGGNNRMAIDRSTLLQLELLVNSKTGKTEHSLIGTIDKTKTVVGGRLLRTNLMMPPTSVDTINTRLDLVDLFLTSEDFFYSVLEHLSRLPDVDKMLSNVALVPRNKPKDRKEADSVNVRIAAKGIDALVCIKSALSALPALAHVLESQIQLVTGDSEDVTPGKVSRDEMTTRTDRTSLLIGLGGGSRRSGISAPLQENHLLKVIIFALMQPELDEVLQAVSDIFEPSARFTRNAHAMRHQECFALKAAEGGLLALLRQAYLGNVDEIYKKADEYAEVHGFHVVVKFTSTRGYFLAVPASMGKDLPPDFIQPTVSGRYIHCTTDAINSLNTRAKDNVRDLLKLTYDSIQDVLAFARERYDALASMCEAIALLDMCHAFADTISLSSDPWCRPLVLDPEVDIKVQREGADDLDVSQELSASLVIGKGRFGIHVTTAGAGTPEQFIPNDTYADDETRFTLITGINGSGKSTYLKQLAIIVVLAHCGCYCPAESVTVPLRDRLCTRIGNADDQENNISTFMMEMKETAFICNNVGPKTLVLIDELGRATSNEDGIAVAWSVAEYLLKKKAMTFFVTHFQKLTELADFYPSVQNIHLNATLSTESREIKYTHQIQQGACSVPTDYGVSLAAACGWPRETVEVAREFELKARGQLQNTMNCDRASTLKEKHLRSRKLLETSLGSMLSFVDVAKAGSFQGLRSNLAALHMQALPSDDASLCREICSGLAPTRKAATNLSGNDESSISSSSSDDSSSEDSSSTSS